MRRVVITGMGMVSPLAHTLAQSWSTLLSTTPAIHSHHNDPLLNNPKPLNLAVVRNFDQKKWSVPHANSRQNAFVFCAAHEALSQALVDFQAGVVDRDRVGICVGVCGSNTTKLSDFARQSVSNSFQNINRLSLLHLISSIPTGALNVKYKTGGPSLTVNTACASGLSAVVQGTKYIQSDQADLMIVGGVQDAYNPILINSCLRIQAMSSQVYEKPEQASRPFDKKRSGFVLGQGCGIMVLEEYQHAVKRGANIYGEILGFGETSDGHHLVKPMQSGAGQIKAMQQAIKRSKIDKQKIGLIDAHATSTPTGDQIQARSLKTIFNTHNPAVTANKSVIGHTLGAAGALQLIFAVQAMNSSILPRIRNLQNPEIEGLNYVRNENQNKNIQYLLKNSFGFGGVNVSVVVGKGAR